MRQHPGVIGAALAMALAGPAAAQTTGLPLRHAGVRTGVEIGAELGLGRVRLDPPAEDETVRTLAASAGAGIGPVGFAVTLARADRNVAAADRTTLTGAAGLRVFGGPLVPLAIAWQAALAVPLGDIDPAADGSSERPWRGSVGLGAALTIPLPVLAITPWLAPRADYLGRQPVSGSRVKAAFAAGVDLGLLNGVVIRAAYDSRIGWEPADDAPAGISFGVGYRFR